MNILYKLYQKDDNIDAIAIGKRRLIIKKDSSYLIIEPERKSLKIITKGEKVKDILKDIIQIIKELKDSRGVIILRCYKTINNTIKICIENHEKIAKDRIEILNFKGRCKEYKNDIILFQDLVNLVFTLLLKDIKVMISRKIIKTIEDIETSIKLCKEYYQDYEERKGKTILDYI